MIDGLLQTAAPLLAPAFTLWGSAVTWLEIAAFVLSVWMVLCNMRVNPLGWPLAIASSALYALLFVGSKLYGEAGLQLLFIAMAGWGWWQWLRGHGEGGTALQVGRLTPRQRALALAATLAAWPLLALLLRQGTDSDVPWLDALPTVASVTGTLLLARKRIENWPTWVAVNVFTTGLMAYKSLWLTMLLYALFTLMALVGWRAWQRLAPPATPAVAPA
ncbi:Ribosyl nicotinamide transporter, PnuC-like [Rubrivivax sp. A210]|uniref:nicotinamide riboside transporter PnuC n=1 Tax=Rubrivivax sp. A210 TaxID=2772301 RepID=UPI00191B6F57|nr:nicotinamide riboside transporter PnuC [Rubrivivax sp. A210]CAD5374571.1 Ribosyl nicotinamide transporter, PnuC-like [Rubrivivax sp. A210]